MGEKVTLDELADWIQQAIGRIRETGVARGKRQHVERLYGILCQAERRLDLAKEWVRLAEKTGKLLGEAPPRLGSSRRLTRARPGNLRRVPPPPAGSRLTPKRNRRRVEKPPREPLELTPELERAFSSVKEGKPIVFVTGGAGTGKSMFIRELRERFPERQSVVLAPTGVAALNAGGQTIHSFCKLPLRAVAPDDVVELDDPELVRAMDLLIVDEVSMVRADVLDGLERFLAKNRESSAPFGGVQIVLVGDLFQLPPVVTAQDQQALFGRYQSPWFFEAHCLKGLKYRRVELTKVFRQRDPAFAEMLRVLREGEGAAAAIAEINRACVGRKLEGKSLILTPTRKAAAEENARRLAALPGGERAYEGVVEGSFAAGSDDRLPAPKTLALKRGAQVMFTRNDPVEKRWVNGTLGTVERMRKESVVIRLDEGDTHEVEPVEWQNLRYAWDEKEKKIVEEVVGTFTQLPLMPAWAVTIHKAQGLTLPRVEIDLGRGAFAEGQVYVALSRCRTLEGLSLTRPVRLHEVRAAAAARAFYAKMRRGVRGD